MKCAIILLVCVGAALAAPEKRFFLDTLKLPDAFNVDFLKDAVQKLLDLIGSDPTEAACEGTCHNTIAIAGSLLHDTCPLICHSFQALVHHYNIHPDATTPVTV